MLRTHVYPAIRHRQIRTIRREEIKEIIAVMSRKGLSASRIAQAHLVINAVFNEAVRNKKLAESPCTDIPVPDVVHAADFAFPEDDELEALAAGLPADWAARSAAASTRERPCGSASRSTRSRSASR